MNTKENIMPDFEETPKNKEGKGETQHYKPSEADNKQGKSSNMRSRWKRPAAAQKPTLYIASTGGPGPIESKAKDDRKDVTPIEAEPVFATREEDAPKQEPSTEKPQQRRSSDRRDGDRRREGQGGQRRERSPRGERPERSDKDHSERRSRDSGERSSQRNSRNDRGGRSSQRDNRHTHSQKKSGGVLGFLRKIGEVLGLVKPKKATRRHSSRGRRSSGGQRQGRSQGNRGQGNRPQGNRSQGERRSTENRDSSGENRRGRGPGRGPRTGRRPEQSSSSDSE